MRIPNKERIKLLVDALRSGEFEQCTGGLHEDGSYCCLGVACEIYRRHAGENGHWDKDDPDMFIAYHPDDGRETWDETELPAAVRSWYGFKHCNPVLTNARDAAGKEYDDSSASVLNDNEGLDFVEIARAFKETFLK